MLHFCLRLKCLIGITVSLLLQSSRSLPQYNLNAKEGDESITGNAASNDLSAVKIQKDESRTVFSNSMHRKLQFDGMFENIQAKGWNFVRGICKEH